MALYWRRSALAPAKRPVAPDPESQHQKTPLRRALETVIDVQLPHSMRHNRLIQDPGTTNLHS